MNRDGRTRPSAFRTALLLLALALVAIGCGTSSLAPSLSQGSPPAPGSGGLAGVVFDSASQDELQGAVVTIQGKTATTDWVGHYEMTGLLAGSSTATVTCNGYLSWSGPVTVVSDTTKKQDFSVAPPSKIEGTVRDGRSGTPVPRATVTTGSLSATTGENGHYTIEQVPAGSQTLAVTATGFLAGAAVVEVPADEIVTLDLVLYPPGYTGTVQGTVTEAISGIQLAGATVTVGAARTLSGTSGAYQVGNAPAGTQIISCALQGYNSWRETVEVTPATPVSCDIRMARPGTTGRVQGQILDMNTGAFIDKATVTIGSQTAVTSASGKFAFPTVPVGTPTVTVERKDYLAQADTVLVEPDVTNAKYLVLSRTPLRKGPYLLYNNDTSSMTVMWQTFVTPHEARLEWGETTAYGQHAIVTEDSNAMGAHQFSHRITGLGPDKRIYYKLSVDGQSATGSFRTAPDPAATKLSFYSYGDTRAGHALWGTPNDHDVVCQALINDMKGHSERQTLLLHDGDVVRHGLDESYWDCQYFLRSFAGALEVQATLPIMASVGNHECYLSNCSGTDLQAGGQLLRKYWPFLMMPRKDRFYYSFDYGPVHFAVVDTWVHPDYKPGTDQYTWLEQDLKNTSKAWKVVYMHTPPWDWNTVDQRLIDGLTPLFQQQGVKLVIAGHVHHYSRCIVDGITYLALGGGGAPLDHVSATPNPVSAPYAQKAVAKFHFGRFDVSADKIEATIIKTDGQPIETFTITR